jgi:hypothetical protein
MFLNVIVHFIVIIILSLFFLFMMLDIIKIMSITNTNTNIINTNMILAFVSFINYLVIGYIEW